MLMNNLKFAWTVAKIDLIKIHCQGSIVHFCCKLGIQDPINNDVSSDSPRIGFSGKNLLNCISSLLEILLENIMWTIPPKFSSA